MKLAETKEGTIIEVFVKPNQREFKVAVESGDIVVSSTEEPAKNKVNKEIIKELSRFFRTLVELASGATSRKKKLVIRNLTKAEVERSILRSNR